MFAYLACVADDPSKGEETALDSAPDTVEESAGDSGEKDGSGADTGPGGDTASESADTGPGEDTGQDVPDDADCGGESTRRRWCGSCAELLAEIPATPGGPATLQGDGEPFDAWCEMSTAGGGWTLAGTNGWGGAWTDVNVLDDSTFGTPGLTADYKGEGFVSLQFRDLYFETDEEYAVYLEVGDGFRSYKEFQDLVPLHNCGVDTGFEWEMSEGTLADEDLCSTDLYISPKDWEGGKYPCGDSESAYGPAWSGDNKDQGCPLNDPYGTSFIADTWDYSMWGDHDPAVVNLPFRMWVR